MDERDRLLEMDWVTAGLAYGLDTDGARYRDFRNFSYSYSKGLFGLDLAISDYIDSAPEDVIFETIVDIVSTIVRGKPKNGYGKLMEYTATDRFLDLKRPIYLERNGIISDTDAGRARSLCDSVERLYDAGLLRESDLDNTVLRWGSRFTYRLLGRCNSMFRIVFISPILDTCELSDRAVDSVVYHEYMHIRCRSVPFSGIHHGPDFKRELGKYPWLKEADSEIERFVRAYRLKSGLRALNRIITAGDTENPWKNPMRS